MAIAEHNGKVHNDNIFILSQLCLVAAFDTSEPTNVCRERRRNGNNYYPHSNIHQYLNSCNCNWYEPKHPADESPGYSDRPGFLRFFTPMERSVMMPHRFPIQVPLGSRREFGKVTEMEAKVWLPSASNFGYMSEDGSAEDAEYVFDEAVRTGIVRNTSVFSVMTRTPQGSGYIKTIQGMMTRKRPCWETCGVFPMIKLDGEVDISDTYDNELTYSLPELQRTIDDDDIKLLFG